MFEEDLKAYVDGELDSETRDRVERAIAQDPALRHSVEELRSLTTSFEPYRLTPTADGLERTLRALESAERKPKLKHTLWIWGSTAAAAAGIVATLMTHGPSAIDSRMSDSTVAVKSSFLSSAPSASSAASAKAEAVPGREQIQASEKPLVSESRRMKASKFALAPKQRATIGPSQRTKFQSNTALNDRQSRVNASERSSSGSQEKATSALLAPDHVRTVVLNSAAPESTQKAIESLAGGPSADQKTNPPTAISAKADGEVVVELEVPQDQVERVVSAAMKLASAPPVGDSSFPETKATKLSSQTASAGGFEPSKVQPKSGSAGAGKSVVGGEPKPSPESVTDSHRSDLRLKMTAPKMPGLQPDLLKANKSESKTPSTGTVRLQKVRFVIRRLGSKKPVP